MMYQGRMQMYPYRGCDHRNLFKFQVLQFILKFFYRKSILKFLIIYFPDHDPPIQNSSILSVTLYNPNEGCIILHNTTNGWWKPQFYLTTKERKRLKNHKYKYNK